METGEINGRTQQLREQNQRQNGEKMVDGKLRTAGHEGGRIIVERVDDVVTKSPGYDFKQLRANQAAPNPPWDFAVIEFTALEKQAHRIQEATDDWAAAEEHIPERVWKTAPLTSRQMLIEGWWGDEQRPFGGSIGTYIRNLMDKAE